MRGYEDVVAPRGARQCDRFRAISRVSNRTRDPVGAAAIAKVAAAHHAAAQFLVAKGDTDAAIDQYRQALIFAPDNVGLLLNLAVLYLRESQFGTALDPLEHARRVAPDSRRTSPS